MGFTSSHLQYCRCQLLPSDLIGDFDLLLITLCIKDCRQAWETIADLVASKTEKREAPKTVWFYYSVPHGPCLHAGAHVQSFPQDDDLRTYRYRSTEVSKMTGS